MADSPEIHDWTQHSVTPGCLTRAKGLTAVVAVQALIPGVDSPADGGAATVASWGLFRLNAMDDGQPDPVHVGQLLMALLARPGRQTTLFANWGPACVGTISVDKRKTGFPPGPQLYLQPPAAARAVMLAMAGKE